MIYCASGMDFDSFLQDFSAIIHTKDIVIFDRSVIGRLDLDAELEGKSSMCERLSLFSRDKLVIIIVAVRSFVGDDCYNSALVIDCGKIVGITDEIYPNKGYVGGDALILFESSLGLIGILNSSDIFYAEFWHKMLSKRVRYLFYLSHEAMDTKSLSMARALAISAGRCVICNYFDQCIVVDDFGSVVQIEFGNLRPIARHLLRGKPYLIDKSFKMIVEK